ncbi:arginine--tRNA ligase [Candidatus Woesebacteria bacterium]|nr:arginine--tRNA ligase [Candidatus Woesebacteria bacterium]
MIKNRVESQLQQALEKAGYKGFSVELVSPSRPELGDYATPVALQIAKKEKKNPMEVAKQIVDAVGNDGIASYTIAKPGFINVVVNADQKLSLLQQIKDNTFSIEDFNLGKNKKIMVEFAHPNTHKAFHIGHLRNITTGEAIARILQASGVKVVRANYQGDVGMHIAKALWGLQHTSKPKPKSIKERPSFLGKAYAKGAQAYEKDEKAKNEIQEINKQIYTKENEKINKLYTTTRQWSLDYFNNIYKRVDTKFDRLYFESECFEGGKKYVLEGLKKGIFEKSEGAVIFPGEKYGLHNRVFLTSMGVVPYEGKDMELVKLQINEYHPDLILHVLGPEQLGYTSVLFKAQEMLFPETKGKQLHLPYGWVRLKKGKMSSREGNVVLGEDLLDEARNQIIKLYNSPEEAAERIAIAAVKYYFLRVSRQQDVAFDFEESLSLNGNSGPYLLYTYVRCKGVLKKHDGKIATPKHVKNLTKEESDMLSLLLHYGEVVHDAAQNFAPNYICTYLYDLAQKYNVFYQKHSILTCKDEDVKQLRLALTQAVSIVLENGLNLLGIKTVEKM